MKKTKLLLAAGVLLSIMMGLLPGTLETSIAADLRNVRGLVGIYQATIDKPELVLDQPILFVPKGSIVIWLNGVEKHEVQVAFKDGKACQDVVYSPKFKGFSLNAQSCFVTTFMPYAATSSLKFTDPGTFEYEVVTGDGKMTAKGKIVVRDL
jgi:hypothetical protein